MKSPTLVRLAVLGAVVTGIAAGAVTGLLLITRSTPAQSAVNILQKSEAAQTQVLAALGPNTTLHSVSINHREQTAALRDAPSWGHPDDTISEVFATFDANGKVSNFSSVVKGTDGHVYQHMDLVEGEWVTTDVASGQTISRCMQQVPCPPLPNYPPGLGPVRSVDDMRAFVSRGTQQIAESLGPSARATTASLDGVAVFVVESYSTITPGDTATYASGRTYIRQSDYWPLRSEQLAPDGHVTSYSMQTVLEVLPGIATDTSAPTP